jgi:hypothetical protein
VADEAIISGARHIVADPLWIGIVSSLVGCLVLIATSYVKLLISKIKDDQTQIIFNNKLIIDSIKEQIMLLIKTIHDQSENDILALRHEVQNSEKFCKENLDNGLMAVRRDLERIEKKCERQHENGMGNK